MDRNEELEQQLWEFVYDLLSEEASAALQEQITSDPIVARAYAEIKLQAELLAHAAQWEEGPLKLPKPAPADAAGADRPTLARQPGRAGAGRRPLTTYANWLVAAAALLLLCLTALPYLRPDSPFRQAALESSRRALGQQLHRTVVVGPSQLHQGVTPRFLVTATTLDGQALAADVEYRYFDADNQTQLVQRAQTDAQGELEITLPVSLLQSESRLEIESHYGNRSTLVSTRLPLRTDPLVTSLSLDKPLYRPGETVYYRCVTLRRFGLRADHESQVHFQITDFRGAVVPGSEHQGITDHGVGNGAFQIPAGMAAGKYTLSASSPQQEYRQQQRDFFVQPYRIPRMKQQLEFNQPSYAPGEEIVADFSASNLEGARLAGIQLQITAEVDGQPIRLNQARSVTDRRGNFQVRFALPQTVATGEGVLAVTADDGGAQETIAKTIPIALGKLDVRFYPEAGDLVAGLENRVYFSAHNMRGEAVEIEGRIVNSRADEVLRVKTEHEGRGVFQFVPESDQSYALLVDGPATVVAPQLPAVKSEKQVVMRTGRGVFEAGQPIQLEILSKRSGIPLMVAATCRGAAVGQMKLVTTSAEEAAPAATRCSLPLAPEADGVIRLTVYDYRTAAPQPIAERLVYRRPQRKLKVQFGGLSEAFAPGDRVSKLSLVVTDENDAPTAATLGVTVVDDALLNFAKYKSPRITTHFLLANEISDAAALEDANFFLLETGESTRALDLLLGTQGWRTFVQRPAGQIAQLDDAWFADGTHVAAVEAGAADTPPLLYDDRDEVQSEYDAALAALQQARQLDLNRVGRTCFVVSLIVLVLLILVAVLRLSSAKAYVPALGFASVCLLMGFVWMRAHIDARGQVAWMGWGKVPAAADKSVAMKTQTEVAGSEQAAMGEDRASRAFRDEMAEGAAAVGERAVTRAGRGLTAGQPSTPQLKFEEADMSNQAEPLLVEQELVEREAIMPPAPVGKESRFARGAQDGLDRQQLQLPTAPLGAGPPPARRSRSQESFAPAAEAAAPRADAAGAGGFRKGGLAGQSAAKQLDQLDAARRQLTRSKDSAERPPAEVEAQVNRVVARHRFPVRVYAYQLSGRTGRPTVRQQFRHTLYWNPLLQTDSRTGQADVRFDLSDATTTYAILVDGHAEGRIGAARGEIVSRLPFQLEPKLPFRLTTGDVVDMPLSISNETRQDLSVLVDVKHNDLLAAADADRSAAPRRIQLESGKRARAYFSLKTVGTHGNAEVQVQGQAGQLVDAVKKSIPVAPRGFPAEQVFAGMLERKQDLSIALPDHIVPGSVEVQFQAFPSPLAELQTAGETLAREAAAAFEQVSSASYPSILALRYMQEHRVADADYVRRAKQLLEQGYNETLDFESPQHGFGWFRGDSGDEVPTAYGLMAFHDMSPVWDVDRDMVQRTTRWLLDRQDAQVGFDQEEAIEEGYHRASAEISKAYVVWALSQTGIEDLQSQLQNVIDTALASDDPYLLALAAGSADVAGEPRGDQLRQRLAGHQHPDGHLEAAQGTMTRSRGQSMKVETTALAALAWLSHPEHQIHADKAIAWIVAQRQGNGGFGSTQATVLALRALLGHHGRQSTPGDDGKITLRLQQQPLGSVAFQAGQHRPIVLRNTANLLRPGMNQLTIETTDGSGMPYVLDVRYRSTQKPTHASCPLRLVTQLARQDVRAGDTVGLNVQLWNVSGQGQPMTIAVVGLPAGLEAPTGQLEELKKSGTFDVYEIRPSELVFYWRSLAPDLADDKKISFTLDLIAQIPGSYTAPASRSYLYYTPEEKFWADPLRVDIRR